MSGSRSHRIGISPSAPILLENELLNRIIEVVNVSSHMKPYIHEVIIEKKTWTSLKRLYHAQHKANEYLIVTNNRYRKSDDLTLAQKRVLEG